jgi:hypothetical protein
LLDLFAQRSQDMKTSDLFSTTWQRGSL